MRLLDRRDRDEALALATIAAAARRRASPCSTPRTRTARAAELGHNERLLAGALRDHGAAASARIVTKGGMTRPGGGWVPGRPREGDPGRLRGEPRRARRAADRPLPDPRARSADAVANLGAGARPAPRRRARPARRPLRTSTAGSSTRRSSSPRSPPSQVALSPLDDRALRGGVVERCDELEIARDRPLPARRAAPRRRRSRAASPLAEVADTLGATPAEVALAWLLDLSPVVVPIPGARRPETARSAASAAALALDAGARTVLQRAFGGLRSPGAEAQPPTGPRDGDVVLVMGIPGAGKSRGRGRVRRPRLRPPQPRRARRNLRDLAEALDGELSAGRPAGRPRQHLSHARRAQPRDRDRQPPRRSPARCVWLDTPLAQAQVNLVERMLDRVRRAPDARMSCARLARRHPGVLAPTSQMRAFRELEPPAADEGFAGVEAVDFARRPPADGRTGAGVFVAAAALSRPGWERALAQGDPRRAAPAVRLEPRRRHRRHSRPTSLASRPRSTDPSERRLPAPRRPADVLVPATAPGAAARVRSGPSARPGKLDPDRHRPRPPQPRGGARRALHRRGGTCVTGNDRSAPAVARGARLACQTGQGRTCRRPVARYAGRPRGGKGERATNRRQHAPPTFGADAPSRASACMWGMRRLTRPEH